MSKVNVSIRSEAIVNLNAEKVWEKLVDFGGTEKFVPDLIEKVIVEGNGIGAVRTIYLKGGGEIVEELTSINSSKLEMKFIILSTPMPVFNYEGVFTVFSQEENKCNVRFESIYEVSVEKKEEMNSIIKNFQVIFLSNLDK
nr:SRPBCC family protein [uncultured Flavobacterium sp.]